MPLPRTICYNQSNQLHTGVRTLIDSAVILAVSAPAHRSQLTGQRPSAMLPALGKPMVVRVMDRLYQAGIRQYIVVIGINEGSVASYLNKQWMPDAKVEFVLKSNEAFATILARIAEKLDRPFLIASYNNFTYERYLQSLLKEHTDFPDHLILAGANLTLSPQAENYYALLDDNAIQSITIEAPDKDTPHLTLAELAICGQSLVDHLKTIDDEQANLYGRNLFQLAQTYATTEDARLMTDRTSWILRVESDAGLLMLNKRLLDDSNDSHILSELPYSVKVIPPVRIDPQVSVGQSAIIGPHVYVERGSSIGYGAKLTNALVLEHSTVPADSKIDGAIVTTKGIISL